MSYYYTVYKTIVCDNVEFYFSKHNYETMVNECIDYEFYDYVMYCNSFKVL